MNKVNIETPIRTFIMLFFLEAYLDLLIGALVNTENDFLFNEDWGPDGKLTITDMASILVGNITFLGCLLFPFVICILLNTK